MHTPKRVEKYEADNARAAASILRNRADRPRCMISWAERELAAQRAAKAAREAEAQGQARLWLEGAR